MSMNKSSIFLNEKSNENTKWLENKIDFVWLKFSKTDLFTYYIIWWNNGNAKFMSPFGFRGELTWH